MRKGAFIHRLMIEALLVLFRLYTFFQEDVGDRRSILLMGSEQIRSLVMEPVLPA